MIVINSEEVQPGTKVVAGYSYTSQRSDELDLEPNLEIIVISSPPGGWWKVFITLIIRVPLYQLEKLDGTHNL